MSPMKLRKWQMKVFGSDSGVTNDTKHRTAQKTPAADWRTWRLYQVMPIGVTWNSLREQKKVMLSARFNLARC